MEEKRLFAVYSRAHGEKPRKNWGKSSVEEGPTDAEVEQTLVGGVVRYEERPTFRRIDVCVGQIEAYALQFEVDVGVDPGVVAQFRAVGGILHGVLSDDGGISRCVVCCKIADIGAQLRGEHVRDLKLQIEIRPTGEDRNREHAFV